MATEKFKVSRDSQALYITIVAKDRLPVFRTAALANVVCQALDEARQSGGFLIFAYVLMPDQLHVLTDEPDTSAEVLRYIKGITARRVIDYLKVQNQQSSLEKLRHAEWKRQHSYSLWQAEKNVFCDLQRSGLCAEGQLHSFEPGARRAGRTRN